MTTVTTKGHTMKPIKTQAIIIDPSNYSLAVACLPGGFATISPKKVFGSVLIINEIADVKAKGRYVATLRNSRMLIEHFAQTYSHQLSLSPDRFIDVERIDN